MLIKIKTQEEFRSDHVTIEIVADRHELDSAMSGPGEEWLKARQATASVEGLSARLYTAEEVADLQASEAELVAEPLRVRINELERDRAIERNRADRNQVEMDRLKKGHVCTNTCKPNAHVAFTGRQRLEELELAIRESEAARAKLERKVVEYDRDRTTERDRADRNKAWAEARLAKEAQSHRCRVQELMDSLAARDRLLSDATKDRNLLEAALHGPGGADAKLAEALKDRDRLAAQIRKVRDAVHRPEVVMALDKGIAWPDDHIRTLIDITSEVRQILDRPELGTSQA